MKSIKKLFLGAAIFAAVLGFVGCADAFNNAKKSALAEYEGSENSNGQTQIMNITFRGDKTFTTTQFMKSGGKQLCVDKGEGTYEGDPTKNGTVTVTLTKAFAVDNNDVNLMNPDKWGEIQLKEQDISKMADDQKKGTLTISDNGQKLTAGPMTLTRK